MTAAFDWTNLGIAGAFVVGTIVGAVAAIRLTRIILEHLRDDERRDDGPPPG